MFERTKQCGLVACTALFFGALVGFGRMLDTVGNDPETMGVALVGWFVSIVVLFGLLVVLWNDVSRSVSDYLYHRY